MVFRLVNALVSAPFILSDPSALQDDVCPPNTTPGHTTEALSPYKFPALSSTFHPPAVPTSLKTDPHLLKTLLNATLVRVFARAVHSYDPVTLPSVQVSRLLTVTCIRLRSSQADPCGKSACRR